MINAVNTVSVQSAGSKPTPSPSVTASDAAATPVRDVNDFVTSRVFIDNLQNAAILQYRDGKTGEVVAQYPSQAQIQAFSRAEQTAAPITSAQTQQPSGDGGTVPSPAPVAPSVAPVAAASGSGSSTPAPSAPSSSGSGGQSVVV